MGFETMLQRLPGVAAPIQRLTFKEKLRWTAIGLCLYYILSQISVYGISETALARFESLEAIIGASFGSLITLGIGPIVTASIVMQLMVGAKILNWDLSTQQGKIMFQGTQKVLALILCIVEAVAYTVLGAVTPQEWTTFIIGMVVLQLTIGGWIIIFLDEVISKWGFGSGVSLFIVAGVCKEIFVATLNPLTLSRTLPTAGENAVGLIPQFVQGIVGGGTFNFKLLLPILMTIIVFAIVAYAQSMRVEIPLAFGSIRGFGRKWPLRFIYTSNMPVILTAALLINIRVWARMLASKGVTILGTFSQDGNPTGGVVSYLTQPPNFLINLINMNVTAHDLVTVVIYTTFMIVFAVLFSVFWVQTAGLSASSVAGQIQASGLQIPGFRRDVRIIEKILERYIPYLAVLGGAFVGLLAAFADLTGALSSGTGILLAVMIVFQMYEQIAMQHVEDMHPALRKFIKR